MFKELPPPTTCSTCGKEIPPDLFFSQSPIARRMRLKQMCFDCAFWDDYMENKQSDTYVISGGLYVFFPLTSDTWNKRKAKFRKFFYAHDMLTRTAVYSTSCQHITDIPEHIKQKFPDQYRFISKDVFERLTDRMCKECLAKGCWDRYWCYWYNKQKAERDTPWNTIPDYHKPGGEECESFINKETMYTVNTRNNDFF